MTENKAIEYLNHMLQMMGDEPPENIKNERDIKEWEDEHRKIKETLEISKNTLEEIQAYRAIGLTPELIEAMQGHNIALINDLGEYQSIGTIDEFKALKEKAKPKKPNGISKEYGDYFGSCPICNRSAINYLNMPYKYCPKCGQALDWSE